jgi:HEAT repeat protein
MPNQAFKQKLAELDSLRSASGSDSATDALRKGLRDRNNYVVARAASVCADLRLDALIPDLLAAFDRFFLDPAKSDPRCSAKHAIASALRSLGHHGAEVYQRGIVHVQLEPAWGGRADTAAGLRGTCALALSECPIDDLEILTYLADALADAEHVVRADAARAIEQLNRPEGALLLRMRLLIGDAESSVMAQCFGSMLNLAPESGVSFVRRFLDSPGEDVRIEAASALAQARDAHAIAILREFWQGPIVSRDVRQAILINLGASPLAEALDFLLAVVETEPVALAAIAVEAVANSRFRGEARERLEVILDSRDSQELHTIFSRHFID